jgi:hypothetical protein
VVEGRGTAGTVAASRIRSTPCSNVTVSDGDGFTRVDVLYIAGIGRSGSTLLDRVLGGHRNHVPVGELMRISGRGRADNELCSCGQPARNCEFWGEVFERLEAWIGLDADSSAELRRLRRRMTEGPAALATLAPWRPGPVRRRLDRLRALARHAYRAVQEVSRADTLVDASKNLAWGRLLIDTPGIRVRVLHLVRDSRGVAHSFGKVKRGRGSRDDGELMTRYGPVTSSLLGTPSRRSWARRPAVCRGSERSRSHGLPSLAPYGPPASPRRPRRQDACRPLRRARKPGSSRSAS